MSLEARRKLRGACSECRIMHKGCNRQRPCSRCISLGMAHKCCDPWDDPRCSSQPRQIITQLQPIFLLNNGQAIQGVPNGMVQQNPLVMLQSMPGAFPQQLAPFTVATIPQQLLSQQATTANTMLQIMPPGTTQTLTPAQGTLPEPSAAQFLSTAATQPAQPPSAAPPPANTTQKRAAPDLQKPQPLQPLLPRPAAPITMPGGNPASLPARPAEPTAPTHVHAPPIPQYFFGEQPTPAPFPNMNYSFDSFAPSGGGQQFTNQTLGIPSSPTPISIVNGAGSSGAHSAFASTLIARDVQQAGGAAFDFDIDGMFSEEATASPGLFPFYDSPSRKRQRTAQGFASHVDAGSAMGSVMSGPGFESGLATELLAFESTGESATDHGAASSSSGHESKQPLVDGQHDMSLSSAVERELSSSNIVTQSGSPEKDGGLEVGSAKGGATAGVTDSASIVRSLKHSLVQNMALQKQNIELQQLVAEQQRKMDILETSNTILRNLHTNDEKLHPNVVWNMLDVIAETALHSPRSVIVIRNVVADDVLYVNSNIEPVYKYTEDEYLRNEVKWHQMIHPACHDEFLQAVDRLNQNQKKYEIIRCVCVCGDQRLVRTSLILAFIRGHDVASVKLRAAIFLPFEEVVYSDGAFSRAI